MTSSNEEAPEPRVRVYRRHRRKAVIVLTSAMCVFAIAFGTIPLPQILDHPEDIVGAVPLLGSAIYGLYGMGFGMIEAITVRLEVGPNGILLYRFRTAQFFAWDDIVAATPVTRRVLGVRFVFDGLLLRQPMMFRGLTLRATKVPSIPLGIFDPRWREGALGHEVRRYAPRLFDPEFVA